MARGGFCSLPVISTYTQFYRIKGGGGSGRPPPPPISSEPQIHLNELYIVGKGILQQLGFMLDIEKNILISRLYQQLSRNDSLMAPEWLSEKISNF